MADSECDEDIPQLSAHALAALQEFYVEREEAVHRGGDVVEEDWQLSQFWYDQHTAVVLAEEAIRASGGGRIACLSCPTLYSKLEELKPSGCHTTLFEFDRRFDAIGTDFVFYDYRNPLGLPASIGQHSFDLVVADPPFLSEECLRNTAVTIKFLTEAKVLLCTGAVLEELVSQALNAHKCTFTPHHVRNLANEFCCYANYKSGLDCIS